MLPIDSHILQKGVPIKTLKLRDVNLLLSKHYGNDWRNQDGIDLSFYSRILNLDLDLEDVICELQKESPLLII